MCVHREHRTGNCRECYLLAHPITTSASTRIEQPNRYAQVVDMPQVWEGDDG